MLSAEELFKYRTGLKQSMPPKGGDKEYMPDGSWLQEKCIEKFHQERERALAEPRVVQRHDLVKGEWKPEQGLVELVHELRNFWEHMGFTDKKRKWLYPEEALFLLETSVLEIWYQGLPMSLQEAYTALFRATLELEFYQVYAHLRRIGYVVLRHQGRYYFTKYERQVGLDKKTKLSRRQKQKQNKGQNVQTSGSKKLGNSVGQELNHNVSAIEGCEKNERMSEVAAKNQSKIANQEERNEETDAGSKDPNTGRLDSEMAENNDLEKLVYSFDENKSGSLLNSSEEPEINKLNVRKTEVTRDIYVDEDNGNSLEFPVENVDLTEKETDDVLAEIEVLAQERDLWFKAVSTSFKRQRDDMEDEQCPGSCEKENGHISTWNFEEIKFPDFMTDKQKVSVPKPNTQFTPQGEDMSFSSDVYMFDKTQFINTKKEKRTQLHQDKIEAQSLEYSYPSVMTGWHKVKKMCKNWQEYKIAMATEKASWERSKMLPHLYGDQVEPLVKPEAAKSTYAVLEQLKIIDEDVPISQDKKPAELPDFDVYAPNTKFRKTSPGLPDFRVKVARNTEPPPGLDTIVQITSYLKDQVPLKFAVVDNGNIAFFAMSDFTLQQDISLG